MAKRKGQPPQSAKRPAPQAVETSLKLRRIADGSGWELVHPRCAVTREDDLKQVQHMIEVGETEIAIDELRWLLNGCTDCVAAHRLLGELALLDSDYPLARGHFGYGFDLGRGAWEKAGRPGPMPYTAKSNQSCLESGKGLAHCLRELGKSELAQNVVSILLAMDPADPLGVRAWAG